MRKLVTSEVVKLDNGKVEEVTISQERATQLLDSIYKNNSKGIDLFFSNCELITELRNSNGFYTLGYNSFKELADELFESGETQAKNMCLIAQDFGERNDDGSYTIKDKELLKTFSATQLLLIRGLHDFDGNILTTCETYGIDITGKVKVTCATLRKLTQLEKAEKKAISLEDFNNRSAEDTAKAEDTANASTIKELQADLEVATTNNVTLSDAIAKIVEILHTTEKATAKLAQIQQVIDNIQ